MKKLTILLLTFSFAFSALGQIYEPQILILTPNEFKYDKALEKDVKSKNKELEKRPENSEQTEFVKSDEFKNQPENIQRISLSEIKFTENLDFSKQASYIAQQYLTYRFYERFTNLLIILSDKKSNGALVDLKQIANTEKMQYVLNFSKIELYKNGNISFAKISVQLYDNLSQNFLINTEFEGDWTNPGFEFACSEKSIDCTINNALSKALGDVIYQVASHSPTIKRERELAQQRYEELVTNYYSQPYNKDFLKPIISQTDSNIVLTDHFQIIIDPTKTKFVAFFIEQVSAQDFKTMKDNKRDKNVNIISSKDIKDEGFLEDIPQTYAYIVKGVKHNNKWYYEKSNVTYFEAENVEEGKQKYFFNLAKWNFFKENSISYNPDFWETSLFEKVKDLSLDPEWEQYGETIWKSQEANNRPYIGLYEIVANQLKREKKEENENFDKKISDSIFIPFYDNILTIKPKGFSKYSMMYKKLTLIYPDERNVIINPIMITDERGLKTLRYFVAIKNIDTIYEWTYFKPKEIPEKTWHYGSLIIEQLETLTQWNFSYKTLNDKDFWDNYVLNKTGDNYKYLIEIE
jgi:hypothetical protein